MTERATADGQAIRTPALAEPLAREAQWSGWGATPKGGRWYRVVWDTRTKVAVTVCSGRAFEIRCMRCAPLEWELTNA